MTGKLMFVPDDWVVVPKEPTDEMIEAARNTPIILTGCDEDDAPEDYRAVYKSTIAAAPQLTTPPVLRWEKLRLIVGDKCIADIGHIAELSRFIVFIDGHYNRYFNNINEARRAAEKALGLPIVEEV